MVCSRCNRELGETSICEKCFNRQIDALIDAEKRLMDAPCVIEWHTELEDENAAMIAAAADALGTDPEYRSAGCVDALVGHYEAIKTENAVLRGRLARLVEAAKYINTAIEKEEPTDDGWFSPSIHVDDYTALKQAIAAAELSGKTGELKADKEESRG